MCKQERELWIVTLFYVVFPAICPELHTNIFDSTAKCFFFIGGLQQAFNFNRAWAGVCWSSEIWWFHFDNNSKICVSQQHQKKKRKKREKLNFRKLEVGKSDIIFNVLSSLSFKKYKRFVLGYDHVCVLHFTFICQNLISTWHCL